MTHAATDSIETEHRPDNKLERFPDAYRTRHEAAAYLKARGYPLSYSTLTKLCALGEGPAPAAWWPLYSDKMLDAWAKGRSRKPGAA
jgi:hypothetical protein